jgi:hypothetical protein
MLHLGKMRMSPTVRCKPSEHVTWQRMWRDGASPVKSRHVPIHIHRERHRQEHTSVIHVDARAFILYVGPISCLRVSWAAAQCSWEEHHAPAHSRESAPMDVRYANGVCVRGCRVMAPNDTSHAIATSARLPHTAHENARALGVLDACTHTCTLPGVWHMLCAPGCTRCSCTTRLSGRRAIRHEVCRKCARRSDAVDAVAEWWSSLLLPS